MALWHKCACSSSSFFLEFGLRSWTPEKTTWNGEYKGSWTVPLKSRQNHTWGRSSENFGKGWITFNCRCAVRLTLTAACQVASDQCPFLRWCYLPWRRGDELVRISVSRAYDSQFWPFYLDQWILLPNHCFSRCCCMYHLFTGLQMW